MLAASLPMLKAVGTDGRGIGLETVGNWGICMHTLFVKRKQLLKKIKTRSSLEKLKHQVHVEFLDLLHPSFIRANP